MTALGRQLRKTYNSVVVVVFVVVVADGCMAFAFAGECLCVSALEARGGMNLTTVGVDGDVEENDDNYMEGIDVSCCCYRADRPTGDWAVFLGTKVGERKGYSALGHAALGC